jgi:hypothetical protein
MPRIHEGGAIHLDGAAFIVGTKALHFVGLAQVWLAIANVALDTEDISYQKLVDFLNCRYQPGQKAIDFLTKFVRAHYVCRPHRHDN